MREHCLRRQQPVHCGCLWFGDGLCFTPNTLACNDGDACTETDTCAGGTCVGGAAPDCDDSNVCTDDFCDTTTGCPIPPTASHVKTEMHVRRDTYGASCASDPAPDCSDGNICTDDTCDSTLGCLNPANSEVCDDGDFCTVGDTCVLGACDSGSTANCDDSNACTADSCDPATAA